MTPINQTIIKNVTFANDVQQAMSNALIVNAQTINGVKYLEIPLAMLTVDSPYQRAPKGRVQAIAAKWDRRKAGVIKVSHRDGTFYILDGQNRFLAAQIVGEESLTCQVYEKLTMEMEATYFGEQTENVSGLTTQEKYKAMLAARCNMEIEIDALCRKYNVVVLPKHSSEKPVLKGLYAAECAYRVYGIGCLEFIFSTVKAAGWHMVKGAYSDLMIGALRNIYANHRNDLEWASNRLAAALEHTDLDIVRARALCAYVGRGNAGAVTALFEKCIATESPVALIASA